MSKIAILLDSASPKELNKNAFEISNKIYHKWPKKSINFFFKNIGWPYKTLEYGAFKLIDYQNFSGPTIITNLELLDFVLNLPHNNEIILYCHDFPWVCSRISGKKVTSLLTNPKITVYSRLDYITDFINSFRIRASKCETIALEKLINWKIENEI